MALYLPKYNVVFIHIYKTGGTSLRTALRNIDRGYSEIGKGHSDYNEIAEYLEGKRVFSVVRNPYSWIYSLYQYALYYQSHTFHTYCLTHSFEKFVVWYFDNIDLLNTTQINGRLQTQTDYLSQNGEIKVPHILKMENLEEEVNQLFWNEYGHIGKIDLPLENATPYEAFPYPKNETIEIINEKYKKDFLNFNYQML
jgi:hypothetical protein